MFFFFADNDYTFPGEDTSASEESSSSEEEEEPRAVPQAKKRDSNTYVLDKHQFCYFCGTGQLNLPRHLMGRHEDKTEVRELINLKEANKKAEYLKRLGQLRCLGNFKENLKRLRDGRSDIIVVKRPKNPKSADKFLPCIHCYGFYHSHQLWRHVSSCPSRECQEPGKKQDIKRDARLLLQSASISDAGGSIHASEPLKDVLTGMHQDELKDLVLQDKLLLLFGNALLKKYGPSKKHDINQRLRQLARLLELFRKDFGRRISFMEIICGGNFDNVLDKTEKLCGLFISADGRRSFKIPSLALRTGHNLKKLALVKQGLCLREDNEQGVRESETFLKLLSNEWTDAVSSNALNTLKRRKDNTIEDLPLADDLRSLRDHLVASISQASEDLQQDCSYSNFRSLAVKVIARLTVFNKRRAKEVAALLADSWASRPDWKQREEVTKLLTSLERKILDKKLDLVMVPGKKSRKVPILIPLDCQEAMALLHSAKEKCGIPPSNPFFFASMSSNGFLQGGQALKSEVSAIALAKPERITSTKCRKYAATITQLFDLTGQEQEWLANHLGHSVNIQKEFYRVHESTIELTKVGKMLLGMDGDEVESETEEREGGERDGAGADVGEEVEMDTSEGEEDEIVPGPRASVSMRISSSDEEGGEVRPHKGKKRQKRKRSREADEEEMEKKKARHRQPTIRNKWSPDETKLLIQIFRKEYENKKYPLPLRMVQARNTKGFEFLKIRTDAQIKSRLQYLYKQS